MTRPIDPISTPRRSGFIRLRTVVGAILLLLLCAAAVLLWAREPLDQVRAQRRSGCSFFADAYAWFPGDGSGDGPGEDRVERVSPGDGIYYQPCIRPDGTELVYAGAAEGPPRIWAVDLETLERRALTEPNSAALHPAYSWDGTLIAFCSDRDSGAPAMAIDRMGRGGQPNARVFFQLYVMDADGGNVRRVTDGPPSTWRPTFHPDGESIVFSRSGSGLQALYEVDLPGPDGVLSEARKIAGSGATHRPWFHGSGTSIYFHSLNGRHRVHSLPLGGGQQVPLENDEFERTHGSFFDPRTNSLLVHARHEGRFGIWELPLAEDGSAGGTPRKLEPPGFELAYHATRAANGTIGFDLPRDAITWRETLRRLRSPGTPAGRPE